MNTNDETLLRAIADANGLKEIATAAARFSVEEQFRPKIQKIVSENLLAESQETGYPTSQTDVEKETVVDSLKEQAKLDSSGIAGGSVTVKNPGPTKPKAGASSSSKIDNPKQEIEPMGEGLEEDITVENEFAMGATDDMAGAPEATGADDGMGDLDAELAEIIAQLEAEAGMGGAPDQSQGFGGAPDLEQEQFDSVTAGQEVDGPITLHRENAVVTDKRVDGVANGKEVKAGEEVHGHTVVEKFNEEEVFEIDEILSLIESEEEAEEKEGLVENYKSIVQENQQLKKSLSEHSEVVKFLQKRINEMTLLNGKLLYTNKLFSGRNLTESYKKKIIKNFDRATNLREVKMLYAALSESVSSGVSSSKKAVAQTVVEGMSSKATGGSTKPKSVIVEQVAPTANISVARMQELANIKV